MAFFSGLVLGIIIGYVLGILVALKLDTQDPPDLKLFKATHPYGRLQCGYEQEITKKRNPK